MRVLANSKRKCGGCGEYFRPAPEQTFPGPVAWCREECALVVARKRAPAAKAKIEKAARAENRAAKKRLKTRSEWMKEAQKEFNAFIRERDKDLPCICCNTFEESDDWKPGGVWDAGHFLSRGAYPELRFEELNCHKQKKSCNAGSSKYARKGRTVAANYRENLIIKIGIEAVEWLEGPHEAKRYTIEELQLIISEYKRKKTQLQRSAA